MSNPMADFFYFVLQFLPYVVALFQGIMYIFVIILLARATGPLVRALKAYAAEHAPQQPVQPVPTDDERSAEEAAAPAEEAAEPEQETTDPQF